jgi:hypothetical protein
MAGVKNIWEKSGKNLGIEVVNGDKVVKEENKFLSDFMHESRQSYNDQKLEFFSYSSGLKLGFEKFSTGQADKLYHGPGPILIKFKETPEKVNK